jgi:hypothetical protein
MMIGTMLLQSNGENQGLVAVWRRSRGFGGKIAVLKPREALWKVNRCMIEVRCVYSTGTYILCDALWSACFPTLGFIRGQMLEILHGNSIDGMMLRRCGVPLSEAERR